MNREMIERLTIDSVAGELNEDAEALFQTYLAGNPQAQQWAEDVRQVFHETETAILTKTALASDQTSASYMKPALRVNWLPVARWAAAIILGTFVGFTAGRWEITDPAQRIVIQEPGSNLKPVETVTDLKEKYVGTFWGDKMLALVDNSARRQHTVNLGGTRSWDTYRQYIKGKRNEESQNDFVFSGVFRRDYLHRWLYSGSLSEVVRGWFYRIVEY